MATPLRENIEAMQEAILTRFNKATATIDHRGAKGRERESLIIQEFLSHYLPASVTAVHSGEIVDSNGTRSAECDVIIKDVNTPPIYLGETYQLVPAECAHGVIEIKSRLDTRELTDAQGKIARVKQLAKACYVPQTGDIEYGIDAYGMRFDTFQPTEWSSPILLSISSLWRKRCRSCNRTCRYHNGLILLWCSTAV